MLKTLAAVLPDDPVVEHAVDSLELERNALGYDAWGFHAEHCKGAAKLAHYIYRYFRPRIHGIENLPPGRVLVVPNHSGQLPFDGLVVATACMLEAKPPRLVRGMAERWFSTLPYVSEAFARSGSVLGDPVNCRNLLEADNAILVFPEGARGSGKTWDRRYQLQPFGRGFMRLALETHTPVLPVAVVGAEESILSVHDAKLLSKLFGTPYWPVPPHLPVFGLLAYFPLPTRFHVTFGPPMHFEGRWDDEDQAIDEKVRLVMDRVQGMVDEGLRRRKSVFA